MNQETVSALMSPKEMIELFTLSETSLQPIEKIADNFPAACEKFQFALLQTYVYHDIVKSKGFPIQRKVYIYEICQASVAAEMLTVHPEFSLFMPCKIAVYEDEGRIVISTTNMDLLLKAVADNEALYIATTSLFASLKALIEFLSISQ
jgi:uncharacterized protein (DUF302 family)